MILIFLCQHWKEYSQIPNQNIKESIFINSQNEIEPVDYIIITRSDMLLQAERLADINREVNGLNVKVVELNKIYNEFSSGNQDISAIRNFAKICVQQLK